MTAIPHWTAYAVALSTAAALSSAVAGFVKLRRAKRRKEADARLELQRAAAQAEAGLAALCDLLPRAKKSREALSAATGQTGALNLWSEDYKADRSTVDALMTETFGSADPDTLSGLSLDVLEMKLAALHAILPQIQRLSEKYRSLIEADDRERERIRR